MSASGLPRGWRYGDGEWQSAGLTVWLWKGDLRLTIQDHPEDQTIPPEVLAEALREMGWTCEPPKETKP